jgi:hypothetical protein
MGALRYAGAGIDNVFCCTMKIYLGFTVAGSRSSIEAAKKILNILQSLGHEVLTSHLVSDGAWEADRSVPPQKIFARDMNWLAQCDLFVAEVTGSVWVLKLAICLEPPVARQNPARL